jgi:hypothetical protein
MTTISLPTSATAGTAVAITATGATTGGAGTWNGANNDSFAPQGVSGVDAGDGTFSYTTSWTPGAAGTDTVSFSNGVDADNASTNMVVSASGGGSNRVALAQAVVAAIAADPNYCADVGVAGTAVNAAVHAYKLATGLNVGTGLYEASTAAAVNQDTGATTAACPSGGGTTPPANNNNTAVTTSTGLPGWAKAVLWIIALAGAVGLGLWLWRTFGSSRPAMAGESKKPKKTGKRSSKKH